MKKLFIMLAISAVIASCGTSDKQTPSEPITDAQKDQAARDTANYTTISWTDSTFLDLGKVKKGQIVEVSFPFTNAGDKNLFITNVTAGCGCTVPEKPQEAFPPGKGGVIKAQFDSNNQAVGEHRKQVFASANTKPNREHQLTFRVEIIE